MHTRNIKPFILTVALALTACSAETKTTPINDSPVCEINGLNEGWSKCSNGQVMAFLPSTFGNEQLPVIAVALYCDFHHPIVHTNGGVSCIFTGARKPQEAAEKKE